VLSRAALLHKPLCYILAKNLIMIWSQIENRQDLRANVARRAGFSLSRVFRKNVGLSLIPPIFFPPTTDDLYCSSLSILLISPPDWIHMTRTLTVLSASRLSKTCRSLVGALFVGAPVRPNMLNMPKSVSGSATTEFGMKSWTQKTTKHWYIHDSQTICLTFSALITCHRSFNKFSPQVFFRAPNK